MSFLQLFFPIATVVLSAACFVCYKTGKPARELLAEKRKAEADKAERDARDLVIRQRQADFSKDFMEMFDHVLRDPDRYTRTVDYRTNSKYPHVTSLIDQFRNWEQIGRINRDQEKQISGLNKTVRELRAEVKEVHRAMALCTGGDY